jgi:hypothetical protein
VRVESDEDLAVGGRPDRVWMEESEELVGVLVLLGVLDSRDDLLDRLDVCGMRRGFHMHVYQGATSSVV